MDSSLALYLGRESLQVVILVSAPILITCIVVGVLVTLFQAVTSMRDMTLSIVPKLLAVGVVAIMFSSWMLQQMIRFSTEVFTYMQYVGK